MNITIIVTSMLGQGTKRGMVELTLNGEKAQMDLDKAREVRDMLAGGIEAAVSDELVFRFLVEKIGLSEVGAAKALLDFRELRQGSRSVVFAS